MISIKYIVTISLICFVSCISKNKRRIITDGFIVEGNIGKDSIYNDKIKFYDPSTNRLISEAFYINDTLNGERVEYYPNGNKWVILNYKDGKENGYTIFNDSAGNIKEKQFYYYGLRVGPSVSYKNGQLNEFRFFSFDNVLLFYINYDSVKNKTISDWQDSFFYISKSNAVETKIGQPFDSIKQKNEYFIYLIEPLEYNFVYSLCLIDEKYNIHKTLRRFDTKDYWAIFNIDSDTEISNKYYAVKLDVYKENDLLATMFKKLD